jgi:hypothetical protein
LHGAQEDEPLLAFASCASCERTICADPKGRGSLALCGRACADCRPVYRAVSDRIDYQLERPQALPRTQARTHTWSRRRVRVGAGCGGRA